MNDEYKWTQSEDIWEEFDTWPESEHFETHDEFCKARRVQARAELAKAGFDVVEMNQWPGDMKDDFYTICCYPERKCSISHFIAELSASMSGEWDEWNCSYWSENLPIAEEFETWRESETFKTHDGFKMYRASAVYGLLKHVGIDFADASDWPKDFQDDFISMINYPDRIKPANDFIRRFQEAQG